MNLVKVIDLLMSTILVVSIGTICSVMISSTLVLLTIYIMLAFAGFIVYENLQGIY